MQKFSLYFACLFTLFFIGCGSPGADDTAQITTLKADPVEVSPGGTAVIVATVVGIKTGTTGTNPTTEPAWGETVTFRLLTANGAQLSVQSQKVNTKGEAITVYTAGNNYQDDTIQATLGNGMSMALIIKKKGGLIGARISSFAASSTTVKEGASSVITATVTDGNTNPMQGETVTFTLPLNESGASFVNSAGAKVSSVSVITDAAGKANAVYFAGGTLPDEDVYDTIRATLANGATNFIIVTRSASTKVPLSIRIEASPTSVTAQQISIITVTVTGDNNDGVTVNFSLPINNSGARLSATTATTDGSGKAIVSYQPGNADPALTVSDTVQATVGSISATVAIMRTGSSPLGYVLTISANPSTLATRTGSSVITANLKESTGTAASGKTITFTCTNGTVGLTATTDGNGNAVTTYTSTAGAGPTPTTGIVTATWETYSNSVIINIP